MSSDVQIKHNDILDSLLMRYPELITCKASIVEVINKMTECYSSGNKILVCGNGGSAADSEHIVGELMKSFMFTRSIDDHFREKYRKEFFQEPPRYLEGAFPAISLVSQTALGTAFANDQDPAGVFAQQVYGYGCEHDILLGISTSGFSNNIIEAAKVAKVKNMTMIALTGMNPSPLAEVSDIAIQVPANETFKIQELHLPVYHCICAEVEAKLFKAVC